MSYGVFGCGCCGEITLCSPKPANKGDLSLDGWSLNSRVDNYEAAKSLWNANSTYNATIRFSSTFTGKSYKLEFSQSYVKTEKLPSEVSEVENFWPNEENYFVTPLSVHFLSSELKLYLRDPFSGEYQEILPQNFEATQLALAIGSDPFAVTLSVWPLSSILPFPFGTSEYPNDLATAGNFDDFTSIDEHKEMAWSVNHWSLGRSRLDVHQAPWSFWGNSMYLGFLPILGEVFTQAPRGYTFLTNGLGPLDTPIHELERCAPTVQGFSFEQEFSISGQCYRERAGDLYDPLQVTIAGYAYRGNEVDWEGDENSQARLRVHKALNDDYTLEWADTDTLGYAGRNDVWKVTLHIQLGIGPFFASQLDEQIEDFARIYIEFVIRHTSEQVYLFDRYIDGVGGSMTYRDLISFPGISHYENDFGSLTAYISDPSLFARSIASSLSWQVLPSDYPSSIFGFDDRLAVTIS